MKFLFESRESFENYWSLEKLDREVSDDLKLSEETLAEIMRLYKAHGLKDGDLDMDYSSLYVAALKFGVFSKEAIEKKVGKLLVTCVSQCGRVYDIKMWFSYFSSTPLSQKEKKVITDYIKENKDSWVIKDYLEDYKAILENIGEKGIF